MKYDKKQGQINCGKDLLCCFFSLVCCVIFLMGFAPEVSAQVVFRAASSAGLQVGSAGISYVGQGGTDNAGSGNINPSLPSYQTGDLLLCVVESHDNVAHAISSGWNTLYSSSSGNGHRASLFWRIAANTSLNDPTITHSGGNSIIGRCASYRGVDQLTPFDVPVAVANSASDFTIESGALTTMTNGAWVLFANHMADDPSALNMTTSGGITWIRRIFSTTTNSNDSGIGLFDTGPLTPQAIGPVVATMNTNAESTGALLALRPAGGNVLTIPKPAGTLLDDIMIASIAVRSSAIVTTPPSGWILVREVVRSGTSSSVLRTYYRIATASEPTNYAWTLSGGTHVGVVGGIASFSGVDIVAPIADEAGAATISALTHVAPSVTTSKANSMLVTVHEYTSAGTWSPPASMTEMVDIASQPVSNDAGISMEMNYELRPVVGATGTRQATANANADLGAVQSLAITPLGGLSCFVDTFDRANGVPGNNWFVGNEGGTFGNPAITNNRLRLTNASTKVSTYATLQRLFPGAGNKIIVEFLQYSYGGSGADGMGIVLSDAAQPPIAGAFGGSLGYAPKQIAQGGDVTHEGFSGGWLGIALDEFGNYSSNSEGRSGGNAPGFMPDSVAIRGSGSGFTGYSYLRGTGTLPVGVDNAGSAAAAPGHKYRIIVDHSDGVHAWTSVERDTTGSGNSYGFVVPVFDAKAEPGQAAVPVNWSLSYTGATGSNANIHEIDSLQVCSITQKVLTLHHIRLEHPGRACGSGAVVIKACADADCTALYAGTVSVNLSTTSGSWSSNSLTFTGGQTTATLTRSGTVNVTIGATSTTPTTSNATRCFSDTAETCVVNFVAACFDTVETGAALATPIYTKLAGTSVSLDVLAVSSGTINTAYTGTVAVSLVDPTAASGNCSDTNAGLMSLGNITFSSTPAATRGRRPLTFNYPYAAKNAKVRVTAAGVSTCSSDNFAIRPLQFALSTTPALNFPVDNFAAGGDFAINADPGVTVGYTGTPLLDKSLVVSNPTSTDVPLNGDFPAATGSTSIGTFQYEDVGSLTFNEKAVTDSAFTSVDQVTGVVNGVDHGTTQDCVMGSNSNTLSSGRYGCVITSQQMGPKGRFRPDHYDVTATLTAACSNKFTYMGQPALGAQIGLQAMSANGVQLVRYTDGYLPISIFSITGDNSGAVIASLNDRLTPDFPASTGATAANPSNQYKWLAGGYAVSGIFSFDRLAAGTDGSYENFALRTTITDSDGVKITSINGTPVVANSGLSNTTAIRFGRLRLANVNGSELMSMSVQASVEYWKNGVGFVTNTDDNCTVVDSSSIKVQNPQGGLNTSNMPSNNFIVSPLSFAGGQSVIVVKKPITTPTAKGSVDLCVDLGIDNPELCTATPTTMPWLQGKWSGTVYDDDPSARATFGVFKSGPVVYLREIY
ncbi:DUF6701 domain-containing protein [Herminiimonas arsenitoxidans]|uniref:DUF6701 domain-containing protein n=1 Tax=Herminiimonas arsenitoxidans TaxID=1809410 RepID=UPI0012FF6F85|nr:DUF6701 domain-containing protein [Herminiimonas arsenitoxidans]